MGLVVRLEVVSMGEHGAEDEQRPSGNERDHDP